MLAMQAGTAAAEQIYRSVDAEGNVTFSSEPPAGAVDVNEVSLQPGPSAAEQQAAQERMRAQEATANEMSEARASRAPQQPDEDQATPYVVQPEEVINQDYGNGYTNTPRRDNNVNRPVQLPARPVQMPARPALR